MTTFPIARATSNSINRISYGLMVVLIVLMVYLIIDMKNVLSILLILPMTGVFIYLLFANRLTQFTIDDKKLHIKRTLYAEIIDKHKLDIDNAQVIDLSQDSYKKLRPFIRTNGIGLPYYQAGWFRLNNKEKALLFVTNRKNVVYIPTHENYSLMLSVENPDSFLVSLKR